MLITKRDKVLLKKARGIFGSIVKNAYIAIRTYEGVSKAEVQERLHSYKFKDDGKKVIDYDYKIVLVFTNNKAVEFTTNEAAWMESVETIEKEDL